MTGERLENNCSSARQMIIIPCMKKSDQSPELLSRRQFLANAATSTAGAFFLLSRPVHADSGNDTQGFLTRKQRRTAAVLANHYIPRDRDPGAAELGAVDYIEQLLTAFDCDPPRIFASDVSSSRFLPLNRYQDVAWRIRLYGSEEYARSFGQGKPYYGPKVVGLRTLISEGLDKVDHLSLLPIEHLPQSAITMLLGVVGKEFRHAFSELVIEATLSQTQYGGNRGGAAWKLSHFDGELTSYGWFSELRGGYEEDPELPMSKADRLDPHPLSLRTRLMLDTISTFTGGKVFRLHAMNVEEVKARAAQIDEIERGEFES